MFIDSADQATMTEIKKHIRKNGSIYTFNNAHKKVTIINRINLQLGWIHKLKYFVLSHCTNHIQELETYSWKENKDNEPEDANDHTINASQYAFIPYRKIIGDGTEDNEENYEEEY